MAEEVTYQYIPFDKPQTKKPEHWQRWRQALLAKNYTAGYEDAMQQWLEVLRVQYILRTREEDDQYELAHDALAQAIADNRSEAQLAAQKIRQLKQDLQRDAQRYTQDGILLNADQLALYTPYRDQLRLLEGEQELLTASLGMFYLWQEAQHQKAAADQQREAAIQALRKAKKLVNAFYFYDGKLALAYKDDHFVFIDTLGNAVIDYKYDQAGQFDEYGLAKVGNGWSDFLIDTTGRAFSVAYTLTDLSRSTEVLDLRGTRFAEFPNTVQKFPQLEMAYLNDDDFSLNTLNILPDGIGQLKQLRILALGGGQLSGLPDGIGQLSSLQVLDLGDNQLTNFPESITSLTQLKYLLLSENPLDEGYVDSLRTLMPDCEIRF